MSNNFGINGCIFNRDREGILETGVILATMGCQDSRYHSSHYLECHNVPYISHPKKHSFWLCLHCAVIYLSPLKVGLAWTYTEKAFVTFS